MSAPSGIKVSDELKSAFSSALSDASDVRALVFTIQGESFSHLASVSPQSTFKEDIALLPPTLPTPKTPASFAYRLDSKEMGKHEWMMITFVPDDAGVRAKMLQASSRSGLLKALGANNFKHDWFATSLKDLTPSALTAHLNHLASPAPLSAAEAALAEVREAEAAEAKRAALDPEAEARRRKAVVSLGGKYKWEEGVQAALDRCAERSDDGWIVCLEIPATNPGSVTLQKSEACTPSQLASKLPEKSPCYTFYSYPTPPPPVSATPTAKTPSSAPSAPRNTFQASQGGMRVVQASYPPVEAAGKEKEEEKEEEKEKEKEKEEAKEDIESKDDAESPKEPAMKDLILTEGEETSEPKADEDEAPAPQVEEAKHEEPTAPQPKGKARVFFLYTCPSSSPIKLRMVYSSGVRGIQQDAIDKSGIEIMAKLETSDIADLTESYLKSSLAPLKPVHSSSLPAKFPGGGQGSFANPAFAAPAFGGAFGRPRPANMPVRSGSQTSQPPSEGPSSPVSPIGNEGDEGKNSVKSAFDAFGPRVGGGGGGFARPRPAGKR